MCRRVVTHTDCCFSDLEHYINRIKHAGLRSSAKQSSSSYNNIEMQLNFFCHDIAEKLLNLH